MAQLSAAQLKYFGEKILPWIIFLAIAIIYLTCLPYTVQHLDSPEIAAKGYLFNVLHPPGYPLQNWLNFIFTHLLPFKTVFWRAALLTTIFSLGSLYLIYATIKHLAPHWTNILWIIPLALYPIYWEYTVIPDVFMLHVFICTALLHVYLVYPHTPRNVFIMTMIAALGACHHHTIIFLFPLLLHAHLKMPLKQWCIDLGCSLMVMFAFYTTIFMMHPTAAFSWGMIDSWRALWLHFIRADYGTFQLVPTVATKVKPFAMFWPQVKYFTLSVFYYVPFLLVLAVTPFALWKKQRPSIRWSMLLVCFLIYLLGFIGGINDQPYQFFVMRFYLLPWLLLYFLAMAATPALATRYPRLVVITVILMIIIPLFHSKDNYEEHNYAHNTIIEDQVINFMNYLPTDKPTVVFLTDDSSIFTFQYLNTLNIKRKDLTFFYPSTFFPMPNQWIKHPKIFQELVVPSSLAGNYQKELDFDNEVLAPNVKKFNFATTASMQTKKFKTIYLPIGRVFTEGKGVEFAPIKEVLHRHDPHILATSYTPQVYLWIYANYAHYYLKKGIYEFDHHNLDQALAAFYGALKEVPYCIPALENICQIEEIKYRQEKVPSPEKEKRWKDCLQVLKIMKSVNLNYFADPQS